jgi:hypothetical protein
MGDLISRSRVIENIWDVFNSYANDSQRFDEYETEAINNAFTVLQKCVENQQTAYSVEVVVSKLEKEKGTVFIDGKPMYNEDDFIDIDKAIDIVRNGGK